LVTSLLYTYHLNPPISIQLAEVPATVPAVRILARAAAQVVVRFTCANKTPQRYSAGAIYAALSERATHSVCDEAVLEVKENDIKWALHETWVRTGIATLDGLVGVSFQRSATKMTGLLDHSSITIRSDFLKGYTNIHIEEGEACIGNCRESRTCCLPTILPLLQAQRPLQPCLAPWYRPPR
jgi:hypothetical protein